MITYLVGEPDMRWALCFLNLLCCTIFLVFEQEDDSMYWFGQDGKCIIIHAEDFLDPEIANTNVFENCSEERLFLSIIQSSSERKVMTHRFRLNLTPSRP